MKTLKKIWLLLLFTIGILVADPPLWIVEPSDYEFNMSLTGVIIFEEVESDDPDDIIGAFVDDVCRGVAQPTLFPPTSRYTFGMSIYSNLEGEVVHFKAYDASNDKILKIEQVQIFESNAVIGDDMNPIEFTTYVKKFTLTMDVNPEEGGTTDQPQGSYLYKVDTVVDISSTPAEKYRFFNWTGDVADSQAAMTSVIMDTNKIVTAHFELITHTLSIAVEPLGGGTTQPAVGDYEIISDSIVAVTAESAPGYKFMEWQGDVADSKDSSTTVVMNSDKNIKAVFDEIPPDRFIPTIAVDPPAGGTTIPSEGEHEYESGKEVSIEASPAPDYEFSKWIGDVTVHDQASSEVLMDQSKTVTAVFSNVSSIKIG
ncbi:hypothetical protein JXA70_05260 [candidate division KSB1 bacterium]|nr:hypothetical protein [candidate division KSB1 bacterium]